MKDDFRREGFGWTKKERKINRGLETLPIGYLYDMVIFMGNCVEKKQENDRIISKSLESIQRERPGQYPIVQSTIDHRIDHQ